MTANSTPDACQVLVVGAGPTGLTLAAHLLAHGVRTRIIDQAAGPATESRALGVHARTLEMLDGLGLADAFVEQGHPIRYTRMYSGSRRVLDVDLANNGSRYGFVLGLPQRHTEHLLRGRVEDLGGVIEQGVELLRFAQAGGRVQAALRDASGHETYATASYLVGCDGAHSRVRHLLELPFHGQPYPQDWLLADVAASGGVDVEAVSMFFHPDGLPLTCIPMGRSRCRIVMANVGHRDGRPPTLGEVQELIARRAPWPIEVADPNWLATFRCQLRQVTTYRRDRVFLAGDAAHIQAPAGGQGMNTGMMDAHTLARTLVPVLDGAAPVCLLDRYEQLRLPAAATVLAFGDTMVKLMTMQSPLRRLLRSAVLPVVSRVPFVERRAAALLSQTTRTEPRAAGLPYSTGSSAEVPTSSRPAHGRRPAALLKDAPSSLHAGPPTDAGFGPGSRSGTTTSCMPNKPHSGVRSTVPKRTTRHAR